VNWPTEFGIIYHGKLWALQIMLLDSIRSSAVRNSVNFACVLLMLYLYVSFSVYCSANFVLGKLI